MPGKRICIVIAVLFSFMLSGVALASVAIEADPTGSAVAITAINTKPTEIVQELQSSFGVTIEFKGKEIPDEPLNVQISGVPFKNAFKSLIKIFGVDNHFINYGKPGKNDIPQSITVHVLSAGDPIKTATIQAEPKRSGKPKPAAGLNRPPQGKKPPSMLSKKGKPEDFDQKVDEFKDAYEWDNDATSDMAGYLLDIMPDSLKKSGLSALSKELEELVKKGEISKVDEAILLDSMVATVPAHMKKDMRELLIRRIEEFKGGAVAMPGR